MASFSSSSECPIITLVEEGSPSSLSIKCYRDLTLHTLSKILPHAFSSPQSSIEVKKSLLDKALPLITCSEQQHFPGNLSFFVVSRYRTDAFKFFFEMISHSLSSPGERLDVVLVYATDFRLAVADSSLYTLCEIMIRVKTAEEYEELQAHFPFVAHQIALGMHSEYYARRLLEVKGCSWDEKTALIHAHITLLRNRFPELYSREVFVDMQHLLVHWQDQFKQERDPSHLGRIICAQHLIRGILHNKGDQKIGRSLSKTKFFHTKIVTGKGRKSVLGIMIVLELRKEEESVGEDHLRSAIRGCLPHLQLVEGSFFNHALRDEKHCILYIEVAGRNDTRVTLDELRILQKNLPIALKNRVEYRVHSLFMPRNEEEVFRNILSLGSQIKYTRDLPQMMISFDEQDYSYLSFTVIIVRVLLPNSPSYELLKRMHEGGRLYIHESSRVIGSVRKKHPKEASILRVRLAKKHFLRGDASVDLYKARQTIVKDLERIFGSMRDYNGGMITKQHERLIDIRRVLCSEGGVDELLVENFFHALSPVIVQTFIEPNTFKTLFSMLEECLKDHKLGHSELKVHRDDYNLFLLVITDRIEIRESILESVERLGLPSSELATAAILVHGAFCIGYICCSPEERKDSLHYAVLKACTQQFID